MQGFKKECDGSREKCLKMREPQVLGIPKKKTLVPMGDQTGSKLNMDQNSDRTLCFSNHFSSSKLDFRRVEEDQVQCNFP